MVKVSGRLLLHVSVLVIVCAVSVYTLYDGYVGKSDGHSSSLPVEAFGKVVAVQDGDTLRIVIGQRTEQVRLIGIDAPELHQRPWGQRARRHLKKILGGSEVRVVTDVEQRDRYGRLLAYLWTSDGRFVNLEMVRSGYAMLYTFPPNVKYVDQLKSAQDEAMEKKKGIWGSEGLRESPSQYRKEHPRKKEFF